MARDKDQIKKTLIDVDFGGTQPRQALGTALKDVEHFAGVLIIALDENGQELIYSSELSHAQLALMMLKLQGYSLGVVNNWEMDE